MPGLRANIRIEPLEPDSGAALAALHREDFARPWTDGEFEQLIAQDTVFGFAGLETGKGKAGPVGFVLARLAAGEAEILTLAVARSHRREGLGWQLMDAVLRELHAQRAEELFLEVDETNSRRDRALPPVRLPRGRQAPALLPVGDGARSGALVMRRDLR